MLGLQGCRPPPAPAPSKSTNKSIVTPEPGTTLKRCGAKRFNSAEKMRWGCAGAAPPTPYTLHPTPYTLHLTPYTSHPTPHTPHPTPNRCRLGIVHPEISEMQVTRNRIPESTLEPKFLHDVGVASESSTPRSNRSEHFAKILDMSIYSTNLYQMLFYND